MIIEINGQFFNPLTITYIWKEKNDALVYFSSGPEEWVRFSNWTCYNLAARINELIEEFNRK